MDETTITVSYTLRYVQRGRWGKFLVLNAQGETVGSIVGFDGRANVLEAYADDVVRLLAWALNDAFSGLRSLNWRCSLSPQALAA